MSQPNIVCRVCGGAEFAADSGFFFCIECNTQSQDVREEVFEEYLGNQKISSRVLPKKLQTQPITEGNKKLTSWEVLNYVLNGITDQLIDLGATTKLKIITLQLWASYLRSLEIAFTSVNVERRPKLGYAFKWSDAEIVYGVNPKQLKGKSWRSRSRSGSVKASSGSSDCESETSGSESGANQSRRSILRRLAIRKKALASAEYSKMSHDAMSSTSQTLDDLDSSSGIADTPKKLKLTKRTKSLLSASASGSDDEKMSYRKKLSRSEVQSLRNVTIAKVVALVNIAMALTQQDIQISDFLRWVEEGHISLASSQKFLPEDVKISGTTKRMLEVQQLSYTKCQNLILGMCFELEITQLPAPDFGRLVERYCLELQLPGDMVPLVKKLVSLSMDKDPKHSVHQSKLWEVQVMSALVIVFKLMFSLDDCTECLLSHTAAEFNRVAEAEGERTRLFVFNEWMQYIECRKAVVAWYHFPTRRAVYGDFMVKDPTLFLQHLSRTNPMSKRNERTKKHELNKDLAEAIGRCLEKLSDIEHCDRIVFPPSLTPLHSCTQVLLSQHPDRVEAAKTILEQDFTRLSLEYITSPERIATLGLTLDLNIVHNNLLTKNFSAEKANDCNSKEDSFIIPRNGINTVSFTVKLLKEGVKKYEEQTIESDTSNIEESTVKNSSLVSEFSDILTDDSDDDDEIESGFCDTPQPDIATCHTTLPLFNTGVQYWLCDSPRNKCSLEEFETFAINVLPSTFLWFLQECSRIVQVPARDLYNNVIAMEKNHINIINKINVNKLCSPLRSAKRKRS